MTATSHSPIKGQGQKQSFPVEVANREKQLWALIYGKGLLHSDVPDLYHKLLSDYEKIILNNYEQFDLQDVEYSLWKLHYKHIDEFRKRIKKNSATTESTKSAVPHNTSDIEGFKSFLSEATEFYQNLIIKVRNYCSLSDESLFYRKSGISSSVEPKKLQTYQFLCHRFLVCLGDLARYREQHEKPNNQNHNWSISATHYMKATLIWPDSGNPQNQLAVLATYVGDEFLALYHCIRSLAVKEPFPDAQNNLILLLERNRCSHLHVPPSEAQFNFLKPFERSCIEIEKRSIDEFSDCNVLAVENNGSIHTNFWPYLIRIISFFFIKSSLDEFPCAFTSCMRELDALMALDDTKLKAILESYQLMDSVRTGPFRAIQVVATLIFSLQDIINRHDIRDLEDVKDTENIVLSQWALTATFIFMGRFVDRCLKASSLDSCPLLSAVLVFLEWLVHMLDKVEIYGVGGKSRSAMSYFFGAYVHLLKRLNVNKNKMSPDCTPIWEDYELRGFRPVACAQLSLNFSSHWEHIEKFERGADHRTHRIIRAGLEIAKRSSGFQWIIYDQSREEFHISYMAGLKEFHDAEKMESISSDSKTELPNRHYCESEKESVDEITVENSSETIKCATIEEEEVILFKPLTRHNSAPLYTNSNNPTSPREPMDPTMHSDDCLRRATSLLIAQNPAQGDSSSFHTDLTNFGNKSPKQLEPVAKDASAQPFPDIPISAGPPSLSAWVLDKGSLNHAKEKVAGGSSKHGLSPIEEVASESLNGLSIGDDEDPVNKHVFSSTHCSTSYSAPVPSAPLLPDDAVWFSSLQSSSTDSKTFEGVSQTETYCNASQVSSYPNWTSLRGPEDCGLGIPGFLDTYPPVRQMTSSEWLRQYRENHNFGTSHYALPSSFYVPGNLENHYNCDASSFAPFDQLGNPLVPSPAIHMEWPPQYPAFPLDHGIDFGQRREKLVHGYQRPNPFGCGAVTDLRNEQQPLLQYLKEKERQLQQDPTVRGPAYMRN